MITAASVVIRRGIATTTATATATSGGGGGVWTSLRRLRGVGTPSWPLTIITTAPAASTHGLLLLLCMLCTFVPHHKPRGILLHHWHCQGDQHSSLLLVLVLLVLLVLLVVVVVAILMLVIRKRLVLVLVLLWQ